MTIRLLHESDAAPYRALRLRALQEEPLAFLASWEEEREWPLEETRVRLRELEGHGVDGVLGAFRDTALVGVTGLLQERSAKARHRAHLWGTYVLPEARRAGYGRALVGAALARARAGHIAQVHLAVVATSVTARDLYAHVGFARVGVVPHAIRTAGLDLDEHLMVCFLDPTLAPPRIGQV